MSDELTMVKQEDGSYKLDLAEGQQADLEATGMLTGLARTEIFGLPVGKAAGALLVVGGWDGLRGMLGGVMPANMPAWSVPAIGAWAMSTKQVSGWVGTDVANAAGLILLADAFQASAFSPRKLVGNLFAGVSLGQGKSANMEQSKGNGNKPRSIAEYNAMHGIA